MTHRATRLKVGSKVLENIILLCTNNILNKGNEKGKLKNWALNWALGNWALNFDTLHLDEFMKLGGRSSSPEVLRYTLSGLATHLV
jgi:hypothetical protein